MLFTIAATASCSLGQSVPGTLTFSRTTKTIIVNTCEFTTNTYTWTFTDTSGALHSFPGNSFIESWSGVNRWCHSGPTYIPLSTWSSDELFYLQGTAGSATNETVTAAGGYVNPKYIILGVTYAPPGPLSFVDYSNSALVGNETDINSSFSSGYTESIKVTKGLTITGWLKGSISATSSTSYSQESDTSSTVVVSKQTTISDQTPGPANPYVGLNHDYDVIWLWLNPVVNFVITAGSRNVQWTGYGYSTLDQPGMDVYPVYVGWLNGDISIPANVQTVLSRAWAAGEVWPSGQVPGLTTTDYQTIEGANPYSLCTPQPTSCPTTVDGTRFTGPVAGENFIYQQAAVGGQPGTQTYTDTYMNTTTQGQGAKYTYSQTFGTEKTFSTGDGAWFGANLSVTLSQSSTLTWATQWNSKITNTSSSTSELSITGAPCVVSGSVCNPVYTGPTEFDVYEDNLYGTFLFFPIN